MNIERNRRHGLSRLLHFIIGQIMGGVATAFNIVGPPLGDYSIEIPGNRKKYLDAMTWLPRIASIGIGFAWVLAATIDIGEGSNQRVAINFYVMGAIPFGIGVMGVVGPLLVSRMRRRQIYAAVRSAGKGLLIPCILGSILAIIWTQDIRAILIGGSVSIGTLIVGILLGWFLSFFIAKITGLLDVSVQQGILDGAYDPDSGTYPN